MRSKTRLVVQSAKGKTTIMGWTGCDLIWARARIEHTPASLNDSIQVLRGCQLQSEHHARRTAILGGVQRASPAADCAGPHSISPAPAGAAIEQSAAVGALLDRVGSRLWRVDLARARPPEEHRSEEHTSELQSHSFISYAVF